MPACVCFVHVLHGPRSQSLYALCMFLADSACVLQVAVLTLRRVGGGALRYRWRDVAWVPEPAWGWLGVFHIPM